MGAVSTKVSQAAGRRSLRVIKIGVLPVDDDDVHDGSGYPGNNDNDNSC